MSLPNEVNPLLLGGSGAYNISRSLRFRSSASAYLNRTFSTPTNSQKWTFSTWVKFGDGSTYYTILDGGSPDVRFGRNPSTYQLYVNSDSANYLITNSVYRDYSAWYHFVVVVDTTQATASNRMNMYVNGVQITSFATDNRSSITQNGNVGINTATAHAIGRQATGGGALFDGYMTETNFIDGQALTPSSFGAFNATTGVWQPAKYTGSYGANGFYLPFTNNASTTTLGADASGNGNNWTCNNISLTAGVTYDSMTDVPTLTSATAANYCVLNPLDKTTGTLSNGNLTWYNAASSQACVRSTMAIPTTGKWYWEAYLTNPVGANSSGIALSTFGMASFIGDTNSWAYHTNGYKYVSGTGTAGFGNTGATGDIFSYDFDSSTGTLRGYWNGILQGTIVTGLPVANYFAAYSSYGGGQWDANFGQRPFAYTPPSGFVALNTYNL